MNSSPILEAREARAEKKRRLTRELGQHFSSVHLSLACLTLRMPAHMRTLKTYWPFASEMWTDFTSTLQCEGCAIFFEEFGIGDDGPEGYIAVDMDAKRLKELAIRWEMARPRGALVDLDVVDSEGRAISRLDLGYPPRVCLICGGEAAVCVAGKLHSPSEVESAVLAILNSEKDRSCDALGYDSDKKVLNDFQNNFFYVNEIGRIALSAVLYEAAAAPKPGLVDPQSSGAHRDMNFFTFLTSAAALGPYFSAFAECGAQHRGSAAELFPHLRELGLGAEASMFAATEGVNTHKGLVFSMGLLCGAAGRLVASGRELSPETCASEAAAIARGICDRDFARHASEMENFGTVGERLYRRERVRGVRGEAEDGFPSVLNRALPRLLADCSANLSFNDAMVDALLELCVVVEDTTVLGRVGREGLSYLRSEAARALQYGGMSTDRGRDYIRAMDRDFSIRSISPGGCADLLADTVFLAMLPKVIKKLGI